MSRQGGDNHFISARERDLKPLLAEARVELDLEDQAARQLEAFLEAAWLAGTRGGHAKMVSQAIRQREEQADEEEWEERLEAPQMQEIEAEFKAMMESAAQALDFPFGRTVALWDLLTRAWTAGVQTYESEVMASLLERRADIVAEMESWLENGDK